MSDVWYIDIETRARVDLTKCGLPRYLEDPELSLLLFGHALNNEPAQVWDCTAGPLPQKVIHRLQDPTVKKLAFNAPFEVGVLERTLGIALDLSQWWDVMALARTLTFQGSLGQVGEMVGLPEDKRKHADGMRLIKLFSVLRPDASKNHDRTTDPEDWVRFMDYCRQDVETERAVFGRLRPYLGLTNGARERAIWLLDQKINRRGFPIDLELVEAAQAVDEENKQRQTALAQLYTGLPNPNSVQQLQSWLSDRGLRLPDLTKTTVAQAIAACENDDPLAAQVLRLRQEMSKTSVAKFDAIPPRLCADRRMRGCYGYYGARTGRWTGGNGLQPHNLPGASLGGDTIAKMQEAIEAAVGVVKTRDVDLIDALYDSTSRCLSGLVRAAIRAPAGKQFLVADFSSIETVVLGWIADCEPLLRLYRNKLDAYKEFATHVFRVPYAAVTKAQRKFCKPPVLGCGFGLGGLGLVPYAKALGVDLGEMLDELPLGRPTDRFGLTPEEKAGAVGNHLVSIYRNAYPEVPAFWKTLKAGAFCAVQRPHETVESGRVAYFMRGSFLFCRLPSGRHLAYPNAKIEMVQHPSFGGVPSLTYEGVNQKTRKWERLSTHPGKLTENIVQALARDLLAEGMLAADAQGFNVVGHTHDEVICEEDAAFGFDLDDLIRVITKPPAWAAGMPIGAAGWVGRRYMKD